MGLSKKRKINPAKIADMVFFRTPFDIKVSVAQIFLIEKPESKLRNKITDKIAIDPARDPRLINVPIDTKRNIGDK
jgi:hypothetical protein